MLIALLGRRPRQLYELRHLESDLFLNTLQQRDIGGPQVTRLGHQRPAQRARTGIKLPHAARNQINQNVGVANFLQCFPCKFRVQSVYKVFQALGSSTTK